METNNKHTPTPWRVSRTEDYPSTTIIKTDNNLLVATLNWDTTEEDIHPPKDVYNAEFIVTACNSYEALKQQNEELTEKVKDLKLKLSKYTTHLKPRG